MDLIGSTATELFFRSIDWGKVQIKSLAKRKKIAELIAETAMRASMTASCVDLGAKFKDTHLVEELLAHRTRLDMRKDEAIRRFLGEGYDDSTYEFVAEFWNSVNEIMSTGEESLAARKAVEGIESANRKLDDLLERTPEAPKEDAEGKLPAQDDFMSLLADHNEAAAKRSGTYQLSEIVNELMTDISSDTRETLFEYRNEQLPLLQCLRESWDKKSGKGDSRPNFILVGEGGIGKTVSMLATAKELCRIGIPAVYISLHALPFLNIQGNFIRSYIEKNVLKESSFALELLEASLRREASEKPSLVMLLDGWNEISEREVGGNGLTDIIQEEIEDLWLSPKNVQVVIAGRVPLDARRHCWRDLKAQSLKRANIEAYLKRKEVPPPKEGDPIWKSLGNPLMLTLYACNETQRNNCKNNPCCRFIDDDRVSTQPAVIWNFLQCQINKACLISKRKPDAFPKILAVHYAAAYIGWEMVQSGVFRISRRGFVKLLDKAKEHFESVWKKSSYVEKVSARCNIFRPTWDANALFDALFFSTKLLINETSLSTPEDQQDDDSAEYGIGFLHQNFRDFYAALFMRNEFVPFGILTSPEDSEAWVQNPQSTEILDMLANLFDDRELDKLWDSTEGATAKKDSNAMFHVVEVMQRRTSLSGRSFENRDLRFVSLRNRGLSGSGVNFSGANFSRSKISKKTFLPKGIPGEVDKAMWLPDEDGGDGRYILTLSSDEYPLVVYPGHEPELNEIDKFVTLWDIGTGLPRVQFQAQVSDLRLAVGVNSNGRLMVVFRGLCDDLSIYDTVTQKITCSKCLNKDLIFDMALLSDSTLIACYDRRSQAYLYDIATDETIPLEIPDDLRTKLEHRWVYQVVCSEDGRKVAILYGRGMIALWAVNKKCHEIRVNFEAAYNLDFKVIDLQVNKDGSSLLAVTTEVEVYIGEREQGNALSWKKLELKIEKHDVFKVSFKHDLLAIAFDNRLDIRSLRSDEHCMSIIMTTDLNSKFGKVCRIDFSPSGEKLVCIHKNDVVTTWDMRPGYSGLEKRRPLFTIGSTQEVLGGVRLQANNTLLTLTGQGRFLKWNALSLRCIGSFAFEGIVPDHWDSSFDGSRYYTSAGSLIHVYDAQSTLIKVRRHENEVVDIRLDEQSSMVIIVDNTPSLVCLDAETLDVVSRVELGDHGGFTVAPLDGKRVVSFNEQDHLTIRSIPDLKTISVINIWEAMARSKKQEIRHIGWVGKAEKRYILMPEFAQLETFLAFVENDPERVLLAIGLTTSFMKTKETPDFLLITVIDLTKGVATMASWEQWSGDLTKGIAVYPEKDRFFQSMLSGRVESRELSTGKRIKSVTPIPEITLVGADFRGAEFETDKLRDMVRTSGTIVDDPDGEREAAKKSGEEYGS